ncbi:MAG: TonB-dependent receptor plug domain-containing protein [Croceibacterium sp.]
MKTHVIAALLAGSALLFAPVGAFAQDSSSAPAPAPAPMPTASTDIPHASPEGHVIYTPADFAKYSPKNALDMLNQVPGFSISGGDQNRGLGEASVNVLINGERLELKSETITSRLQKISADRVERIEIVDGASLKIPGLSGQVANIVTKKGGLSGQFEWDTRFRPGYVKPEWFGGNVSLSGSTKTLDYTLSLSNDNGRGAIKGPTDITDANGVLTEHRAIHQANTSDGPKVSGSLKWNGPGTSVLHLNGSYQQQYFDSNDIEDRTDPGGVDRHYEYTPRDRDTNYEIGGDYEFKLGPGRLKLIGLDRYDHDRYKEDVVLTYADGSPNTGGRYASVSTSRERVARAEYNWKMFHGDWQLSAESAFNSYDGVAHLYDLDPSGHFSETPFPGGTGGVTEDRFESILTHGRQLTRNLSLQIGGGVEYSKIAQTGSMGLTRTFWRPKGSASLSWTPQKSLNLSLKFARVVGQLSFADFLAHADLNQGNGSSGNVNLVPPQSWELNFEAKRDLGKWGTTTLKLYGKWYQDYIDYIPLPGRVESRGNIHKATMYGTEWVSTFNFDPLGWKGAKIDADLIWETSSLKDPLTGIARKFSNETDRVANVTLRDDLPNTHWAWGAGVQYNHVQPYYRLFEVGINYEGPAYTFVFIENKDVFGLDIRGQIFNPTGGRHYFRRTVYDDFRDTGSVLFHENGNQSVGWIYSLSVKGKF